jgi:hypothetical protein
MPTSSPLSISQLTRLAGTTPRALRHYESLGLLAPRRTPDGIRLFSPFDCERAVKIVYLRRFDLPLEVIRKLLDADVGPEARTVAIRKALEVQLHRLEAQIPRIREALRQTSL